MKQKLQKKDSAIKRVRLIVRCFDCQRIVSAAKTYAATFTGDVDGPGGFKHHVSDVRVKLCASCVARAEFKSGMARKRKVKDKNTVLIEGTNLHDGKTSEAVLI